MNKKNRRKVNLAIDALGIHEVGGARSVTIPLLKQVFEIKQEWQFFCFLTQFEKDLDFQNVKQIILPLSKGLLSRVMFQLIIPILTVVYKIDLIHFIKSQASFTFFSKKVLTIYDCTIVKYPQYFSWTSRLFWRYLQATIIKNMDKIITISHDAKSELLDYYSVSENKISVIYPAPQFEADEYISETKKEQIKQKYPLKGDYLLYLGQIGLKKNLNTLIKAYKIIKECKPGFPPLVLVGPRYYLSDAGEIFTTIEKFDLQNSITYLGSVEKDELRVILENASMLLFPSVHEGFGIPLVEAMQLGVPVIASKTSVMPEVIDDAGLYVNEFLSPSEWADKIIHLYYDNEFRKRLVAKGKKRVELFSWDKSAEKLISIYEKILQ